MGVDFDGWNVATLERIGQKKRVEPMEEKTIPHAIPSPASCVHSGGNVFLLHVASK